MSTITEREFKKLCDDLYADRESLQALNPGMKTRNAALWMLYGSLVCLLDVPADFQPSIPAEAADDPYPHAVCELLRGRTNPVFDAGVYVAELSQKLKDD